MRRRSKLRLIGSSLMFANMYHSTKLMKSLTRIKVVFSSNYTLPDHWATRARRLPLDPSALSMPQLTAIQCNQQLHWMAISFHHSISVWKRWEDVWARIFAHTFSRLQTSWLHVANRESSQHPWLNTGAIMCCYHPSVSEKSSYWYRTAGEARQTARGYTIIFPDAQGLKYQRKQRIKFNH